ncbi:uncharacterized protein LOC107045574 [Diachasma alloeum]|uniref:uncharacterized protein LOC107045574 n=1 Tax=Diachasma alloeum TaxID=454923 RepID=UPI0007382E3B|nr:uncharacterized protein LOC107045574 [Diachasma alloeum]
MWDRHEQLIADLITYMKEKRSINAHCREMVNSISTSAKRLRQLGGQTGQTRPLPVTSVPLFLVRTRTLSEGTATTMASELEDESSAFSDTTKASRTKRKSRESPPTDTRDLKKKKREEREAAHARSKRENPPAKSSDWEQVKSRKERQQPRLPEKPPKKKERQKKQGKSAARPNALIFRPKDKQQYSEMLKVVKQQIPSEQARDRVDKIRRTTTGYMPIIVAKDKEDQAEGLRKAIAELLGDDDLDELTTKEEVLKALQLAAAVDCQIPLDVVRSLRNAFGGTQTASVTAAATVAKNVLGERGKIRIGWVNCRIRRVDRLVKCFKCWHYGHLAIKCKSEVDRVKLCTKCGEAGLKAAACEKEARCALCSEKDRTKNCAHIAGSSRCPIFREALQRMNNKRHLDTQLWETDKSRKAAIWSCGKFPFQSVANTEETGFVVTKLEGIHFYSWYSPPSLTFGEFTDFLHRLTEDAKQHFPVAIAGDVNAWAVDWGSKETNTKGQAVLEAMSSLDVVLLNSGNEPTFVRGERSSIVDLTYVSSALAKGNYSWKVTDIYTASDHRAILWEVYTGRRIGPAPKKTNAIDWKVSTFDPSSCLVAFDDCPISGRNAKEKTDDIMRRVTEACDATMPKKQASNRRPPVYWWNTTITVLRKECNAARRSSQRGRKKSNIEELAMRYKKARRKLNKAIKCSKKQSWNDSLQKWKATRRAGHTRS